MWKHLVGPARYRGAQHTPHRFTRARGALGMRLSSARGFGGAPTPLTPPAELLRLRRESFPLSPSFLFFLSFRSFSLFLFLALSLAHPRFALRERQSITWWLHLQHHTGHTIPRFTARPHAHMHTRYFVAHDTTHSHKLHHHLVSLPALPSTSPPALARASRQILCLWLRSFSPLSFHPREQPFKRRRRDHRRAPRPSRW